MFAKISLTAAFLLLMAPPMACASNRNATNPTSSSPASQAGIVVAQDNPAIGTNDNDNNGDNGDNDASDNNGDSNDNDDNQNADGNQMNEQNAAGGDQQAQPDANGGDNDQNDSVPQFNQQQPENPNQ